MSLDVITDAIIDCPRERVAGFSADPKNAPLWYLNIRVVRELTEPPLRVGSRYEFEASFLGRTLVYTYEVSQLEPGRSLTMSTFEGPFPMETTYTWDDAPDGGTRMSLRNRGEPSGFEKLAAPFMAVAIARANTKDLDRLKAVLEGTP